MSQTDQAGEQSLEQILSSIREKIATNDDISSAEGNTADAPAPQSSPARDTAPGARLRTAAHDDDLSDFLENPLPEPITKPSTAVASKPASSESAKAADAVTSVPAPSNLELGNVVPGQLAKSDNSAPTQFGALAAKLTGAVEAGVSAPKSIAAAQNTTAKPDTSPKVQGTSDAKAGSSIIAAQQASTVTKVSTSENDGIPRSMPTMASALNMAKAQAAMTAPVGRPASGANGFATPSQPNAKIDATAAAPKSETAAASVTVDPKPALSNGVSTTASPAQIKVAPTSPQQPAPVAPTATIQPATSDLAVNGSKTVEDLVAEMLRPMLNDWLEANMPRIVENALRIEVLESSKDDSVRTS